MLKRMELKDVVTVCHAVTRSYIPNGAQLLTSQTITSASHIDPELSWLDASPFAVGADVAVVLVSSPS